MSTFTIETAGVTDAGNVRPTNEDHFMTGGDLFAVADGMGGTGVLAETPVALRIEEL